jgi:hypothetical protein
MLIFDARPRVPRVAIAGTALLVLSDVLVFLAISSVPDTAARVGLILLSSTPMLGMAVYALCYVTRIERTDDQTLRIHTLLGSFADVARSKLERASYHEGEQRGDVSVHAPWITLRVQGRALPFVIDMQGEIADRNAFNAALRKSKYIS